MKARPSSLKKLHFLVLVGIVYYTSAFIALIIKLVLHVFAKPWNARLYRRINYYFTFFTNSHVTFMIDWWSDSEYDLYTDPTYVEKYLGKENAFVISNHGKELGAYLKFPIANHFGVMGNFKALVKNVAKFVPVYGQNWIFDEHIFIHRNWEKDQKKLSFQLENLLDNPYPLWFLIFPEGTRLTPERLEESQKVAKMKGLPILENILLPRKKGFVTIVNQFRGKVPALYDFTVVVSKDTEKCATIVGIFSGRKFRYKVMLKRYSFDELPKNDEDLVMWLHHRYQEKDKFVANILSTGEFEPKENSVSTDEMRRLCKNFEYVKIPKSKNSLLMFACSSVIILGSLFTYLILAFMNGKFLQFGVFIAGVIAATVGLEIFSHDLDSPTLY